MTERAADPTPESKEATHQRFYNAFHDWFMSENSSCDFWSECNAPEELATIAVELSDTFAQARAEAAVEKERKRTAAAINAVRDSNTIKGRSYSACWMNACTEIERILAGESP